MASNLIRIGDEIINLDNLIRVERGNSGDRQTVLLYFVGDQRSQSQYTDEQAAALWERFSQMAEVWEIPEPLHHAPGGAGRTARPT